MKGLFPLNQLLAFSLILICTYSQAADNTLEEQFETAYATYKNTSATPTSKAHINAARQAYEVGRLLYADQETLAKLAVNYAVVAPPDKADELIDALLEGQAILEARFGKGAPELIDTLFTLGRVYAFQGANRKSGKAFNAAIEIAEIKSGDQALVANLTLAAGKLSVASGDIRADKYLRAAIEAYALVPGTEGVLGGQEQGPILQTITLCFVKEKRQQNNCCSQLNYYMSKTILVGRYTFQFFRI